MRFKVVLMVDVDVSKCSKCSVLPDIVDSKYIKEQIGESLNIDHPAVGVTIKSVKEIKE